LPAERAAAPLEAAADLAAGAVSVGLAVAGTVADGTLIWSGISGWPTFPSRSGSQGTPACLRSWSTTPGRPVYAEPFSERRAPRRHLVRVGGSGIGGRSSSTVDSSTAPVMP